MKNRSLKIEESGDFHARRIQPKIRLSGRWLERAGFPPGQRVSVELSAPGTLVLRVQPQAIQPQAILA